jgi:hypothetical protein
MDQGMPLSIRGEGTYEMGAQWIRVILSISTVDTKNLTMKKKQRSYNLYE